MVKSQKALQMKNIIALIDFTRVSEAAVAQGGKIARTTDSKLTLLHVAPEEERKNEEDLIAELKVSAEVLGKQPISTELHVEFGDFQSTIADLLVRLEADLVLIGTHGIRGIQRNLFSKNIAKLVQELKVPSMVVQGQRDQATSDLDDWLLVGVNEDELTQIEWIKEAYKASAHPSKKEKVEAIEEEAFDNECNLIVFKGDSDMSVDLVLNSFGIPVLLV
jgi:nucleotide-binding universal stress UspA family protein